MKRILTCFVCNSKDISFLFQTNDRMFEIPGSFIFNKCDHCSLLFINPQPNQKELRKFYPSQKYYSYKTSTKKSFFELLREYLIRHYYSPNILTFFLTIIAQNVPAMPSFVKKGKILDLGCGAGETLSLLRDLGWETYGIDMDKNAIKNAKNNGLGNIILGTYKKLEKYPDNFFHAIRLYHVIEHIDNPAECLELIYKKLKKNGELIIGTPNSESWIGKIFQRYWYNLDAPRHLIIYNPKTLRSLLKKNKFTSLKVGFCSGGGIVGSIQYAVNFLFDTKFDFIHKQWLVILFYPLERLLDILKKGDIFVIRAKK